MSLCGSECVAPCAIEAVADQRTVCSSERHHRNAGPSRREDGRFAARQRLHAKAPPQSLLSAGSNRLAELGAVLAELLRASDRV